MISTPIDKILPVRSAAAHPAIVAPLVANAGIDELDMRSSE